MQTPCDYGSVCRKQLFDLPEGIIYLDGNSLGPLPKSVKARLDEMIADEWGQQLIRGWNDAGWMEQPGRVGNLIARLIGAPENSVVMGDTLSIKVYQALGKRENVVLVCHNRKEFQSVRNLVPGANIFFKENDFPAYLKFYQKAKFGIVGATLAK